jgi:hypothetical protein
MAHFAKLDENNIVLAVHVVNNDVITVNGVESEQVGIDFLTDLYGHTLWKQTSYNGSMRKNYAGVGYSYDASRDAFIAPQPWPSWTFNEDICRWECPVAYPTDGKHYGWFEPNQEWIEVTGPQA